MSGSTPDPTLDRLLRHMAWANAALIARLAEQQDSALKMTAPRNEWSAARILAHLVSAAGGYASRLEQAGRPPDIEPPTSVAELTEIAARCAALDARLRAQAGLPDELLPHANPERPVRARSTILAQAIHHATEHRAQIAGALATNGLDVIDLDSLDLWAYGEAEGAGA
ncbi:MAG TPA: DinB family protein [Candidatus Dormibacteraeota bacterium]|nr:DinB family protein [Candidatus Dormibacteraeota bacterium]